MPPPTDAELVGYFLASVHQATVAPDSLQFTSPQDNPFKDGYWTPNVAYGSYWARLQAVGLFEYEVDVNQPPIVRKPLVEEVEDSAPDLNAQDHSGPLYDLMSWLGRKVFGRHDVIAAPGPTARVTRTAYKVAFRVAIGGKPDALWSMDAGGAGVPDIDQSSPDIQLLPESRHFLIAAMSLDRLLAVDSAVPLTTMTAVIWQALGDSADWPVGPVGSNGAEDFFEFDLPAGQTTPPPGLSVDEMRTVYIRRAAMAFFVDTSRLFPWRIGALTAQEFEVLFDPMPRNVPSSNDFHPIKTPVGPEGSVRPEFQATVTSDDSIMGFSNPKLFSTLPSSQQSHFLWREMVGSKDLCYHFGPVWDPNPILSLVEALAAWRAFQQDGGTNDADFPPPPIVLPDRSLSRQQADGVRAVTHWFVSGLGSGQLAGAGPSQPYPPVRNFRDVMQTSPVDPLIIGAYALSLLRTMNIPVRLLRSAWMPGKASVYVSPWLRKCPPGGAGNPTVQQVAPVVPASGGWLVQKKIACVHDLSGTQKPEDTFSLVCPTVDKVMISTKLLRSNQMGTAYLRDPLILWWTISDQIVTSYWADLVADMSALDLKIKDYQPTVLAGKYQYYLAPLMKECVIGFCLRYNASPRLSWRVPGIRQRFMSWARAHLAVETQPAAPSLTAVEIVAARRSSLHQFFSHTTSPTEPFEWNAQLSGGPGWTTLPFGSLSPILTEAGYKIAEAHAEIQVAQALKAGESLKLPDVGVPKPPPGIVWLECDETVAKAISRFAAAINQEQ